MYRAKSLSSVPGTSPERRLPHDEQKRLLAGFGVLQFGHDTESAVPQFEQNAEPALFEEPQFPHSIAIVIQSAEAPERSARVLGWEENFTAAGSAAERSGSDRRFLSYPPGIIERMFDTTIDEL